MLKQAFRLVFYCSFLVGQAFTICQNPPSSAVEVSETEPIDTVILNLGGSANTIWSLSVAQPASHDTQMVTYFRIASDPINPVWLVVLEKQLDLEQIYADFNFVLETVTLELTCTEINTNKRGKKTLASIIARIAGAGSQARQFLNGYNDSTSHTDHCLQNNLRTPFTVPYSAVIAVKPVSEFAPVFLPSALTQDVPEDAPVNSAVFDLLAQVFDADINHGTTDIAQFESHPHTSNLPDGYSVFDVAVDGKVRLLHALDFDAGDTTFSLNVTVRDTGGLSSQADLRIVVRNVNDNPPVFHFSRCSSGQDCGVLRTEYRATVDPAFTGLLTTISPNDIQAEDPDLDPVSYRFLSGSPANFSSYLMIDGSTGGITLTRAVGDLRVGHFSITVEAFDVSTLPASTSPGSSSGNYNRATCVLLVLVSGRETEFPAVIGQSTNSSDRDSLFISTVCLAALCALAIVLLLLLVICLCRKRRKQKQMDTVGPERCHTLKERRKPKLEGAIMRSVHSDSEKRFIRELSVQESAGNDNFAYQSNGYVNNDTEAERTTNDDDDVFVTDIDTYYSLQGVLQGAHRSNDTSTPELIAFQDALCLHEDEHDNENHLTDNNNPRNGAQNADAQMLNPRNLQSQYRAIDLLTSVAPFEENGVKPFSSVILSPNEFTPASSSAGTCRSTRSMQDADVIGELEDLMAGRRASASPSPPPPPAPLSLPLHIRGFLPEQTISSTLLDEAVTPFPSSPTRNTDEKIHGAELSVSPNRFVSELKPILVRNEQSSVLAMPAPPSRILETFSGTTTKSNSKSDNHVDDTLISEVPAIEPYPVVKPYQPDENMNSKLESSNSNLFTVSL